MLLSKDCRLPNVICACLMSPRVVKHGLDPRVGPLLEARPTVPGDWALHNLETRSRRGGDPAHPHNRDPQRHRWVALVVFYILSFQVLIPRTLGRQFAHSMHMLYIAPFCPSRPRYLYRYESDCRGLS